MQLFIDTADPEAIKKYYDLGIIDGVTTNPSLAAKVGRAYRDIVNEIIQIVNGPISLEVLGTNYDEIMREARALAALSENVVVKIPMLPEGIKAVKHLSQEGIKTNVTLVFSAAQAWLAAKAGASYVSPFIGRIDDIAGDGIELIAEIRDIFDNGLYETKILAASDRTPRHVVQAAMLGADVATVKPENIDKLFKHPLSKDGLDTFLKDFESSGLEPLV